MNIIKINNWREIPDYFTGIADFSNGTKEWYKDGKVHRLDGPAIEHPNGEKYWVRENKYHREDGPAVEFSRGRKDWYLEDIYYARIYLESFVVLDYYKGKFGIMWYKLLDEDEIFEYPDIPGLIEK